MTYSEIKITFNQDLSINDTVTFFAGDVPNGLAFHVFEKWVNFRQASNQVSLGIVTSVPGERSAINFITSFNLDYNSNNSYVVSRDDNEVLIKGTNPLVRFDTTGAEPANPSSVDFDITNYTETPFGISSITFSEASNPCDYIRVSIETSEVAQTITGAVNISNNTSNPFSFDYLRSVGIIINCESSDGQTVTQTINLPASLNPDNITPTINNSPEGATVIIDLNESFGLELEYSLDGNTWQSSNTFNGLAPDNYVLHVRDQYGCSIIKNFVIDEFGINSPYFLISKSNSIRYANRIEWGDCSNYKNDENTLSCEADVKIAYTEIQQFQSCDIITTQFKSNYSENLAHVLINGTEVPLNVEQKTANMRLKDMRDARKFNLGDGKTGVYFLSGNIYDYDTGLDTGDDYTLNGTLPLWGVIGNYMRLDLSWYFIENIVFDEDRNAEVLVLDTEYLGADVIVPVSCFYNRFNYEVFEFSIDMVDYLNEEIQVRINNNDTSFGNLEHLSELIDVKVRQENTVEIRYSHSTNTDIFYATGIENKIRIPIYKINGQVSDESESYKTDTTAILLSSEIHELDEFEFEPVTKEIMRKICQALSHNNLQINGVAYAKNDSIEVEGALEDTNLYVVKASMIKAENVYNSNSNSGFEFSEGAIEIPGLIDSGDGGFVTY
jgi:hypothetical protein